MNSNLSVYILATICTALIYILSLMHITDPLVNAITLPTTPLFYTAARIQIEINNEFNTISQARVISNQYRAVQEQNLILRSQLAKEKQILDENKKLREQLGAPQLDKFKLVPAKIVSREGQITLTYDQNHAVSSGSIVVSQNHFVGKIKAADSRSAVMIQATDPQMQIPVEILTTSSNKYKALMHGDFGTGMIVDHIVQEADIKPADTVILARAPGLPEGVVVGEVRDIQKRESDLFQLVKVKSFLDFTKLETVFIIQ